MIKSFRHKGLKLFYLKGDESKVQASHISRLRLLLSIINSASEVEDIGLPGFGLHPLKGKPKRWSVSVNGNWRITFEFRDGNAYILDYEDYH